MLLANQKEKEKLDTNYEEFWMDSDKFWICNPFLFQSKSIRVPKHLSKLRRGKFGYVGKSGKKSDIIDSKKTHENSVSLHKWCVQEYQKEIENKTETDRRNDLAGKKIVRNASFCFQESLGSKAFVRLNMKDFLAEEDLGLKLYNIATKNDSKKQFFWLRNVVFYRMFEITWFLSCVGITKMQIHNNNRGCSHKINTTFSNSLNVQVS